MYSLGGAERAESLPLPESQDDNMDESSGASFWLLPE